MKILVVAIVVIAIVGTGCLQEKQNLVKESKEDTQQKEEIVPVRESISATAPSNFVLAKKLTGRDIPNEEGVKVEQITVQGGEGGTVTMQALLANQIDTAGGSISIWLNVIAKGGKVKLLLPGSITEEPEHSGLLVLENSSIRSIKDLAGKKIAVNVLGAEAEFIIKTFLKQNGLSINQVELVVIPTNSEEQALRAKQVDAIAGTTSGGTWFDRALDNGGVRRLPGTSSFETRGSQKLFTTSQGFRDDFIQKHPETVRRYLRAYENARRIVYEEFTKDPERVRKAYAEGLEEIGGNPKLAKYYRGPRWSPERVLITDADIQFWVDNFEESGIIKPGQIKPSDLYTNEFNPNYKK